MNVKFNVFEAPEVPSFYFKDSRHVFDVTKDYGKPNREMFLILHMNAKNGLIAKEIHSIGTINNAPIYPREIARSAILNDSSSVILIHNHPSGDPTPSEEDKAQTRIVMEALDLFGIIVLDHIILGRDTYYSFSDKGLIETYSHLIKNRPRE